MKVKKISIANVEVDALPELLDKEKIGFQTIDNVNWKLILIVRKWSSV